MADPSPNSDTPDPFASSFDEDADIDDELGASSWEDGPSGLEGVSPSMAVDVARMWVRRHQKASMLGAFAVGVFVGAVLRD